MAPSLAVVGLGNIVFGDEGLGVYALKYFEANYSVPPGVTLLDGAVLGFGLMPVLQEYDHTVILSSAFMGDTPGEIVACDAETFMNQGAVRKSANEAELTMMLEICAFSEATGGVTLLTMVPEKIDEVTTGLTPTVTAAIEPLVARLREELARLGAPTSPKAPRVPLEAVIERCANPTQDVFHTSAG